MHGPQQDWSRFTGQDPVEYEGFGWASAVHPEDISPTLAAWSQAVTAWASSSVSATWRATAAKPLRT